MVFDPIWYNKVPSGSIMPPKVERCLTIEKILTPFLTIGRYIGLYPCSNDMNKSVVWSIPTILWILISTNNSIYNISYTIENVLNHRKSSYIAISEIFHTIQAFGCFISSWLNAGSWLHFIKAMKKAESELAKRGLPVHYNIRRLVIDFFIRMCILSSIIYLRASVSTHLYSRLILLSRKLILSWAELMTMASTISLKQGYQHLNKIMSPRTINTVISTEQLFYEAYQESRNLCELRLLTRVSTSYAVGTIEVYFFINTIFSSGAVQFKMFHVMVALFNIYEVSVASYTFQQLTQQVEDFRKHLYKIVLTDETHRLVTKWTVRARLNVRKSVSYSACGLFPLDPTLIHSILATSLNYILILYQFSNVQT